MIFNTFKSTLLVNFIKLYISNGKIKISQERWSTIHISRSWNEIKSQKSLGLKIKKKIKLLRQIRLSYRHWNFRCHYGRIISLVTMEIRTKCHNYWCEWLSLHCAKQQFRPLIYSWSNTNVWRLQINRC
jgi:hypothetical protein